MADLEMQQERPSMMIGFLQATSPPHHTKPVNMKKSLVDKSKFMQGHLYKVNYSLKSINELEYEPLIVSIGPNHHRNKERLLEMEMYKEHYLKLLCDRAKTNQKSLMDHFRRNMADQVYPRYECSNTNTTIQSEEFVPMIVRDGCFVVELFRRFQYPPLRQSDTRSPIFKIDFYLDQLFRDLLLFENQLPLYVLNWLFEMTKGGDERGDFVDLSVRCLRSFFHKPAMEYDQNSQDLLRESPHLLGLAYLIYLLPFPELPSETSGNYKEIRSATELQEAGVEFKIVQRDFGAVKFDGGVLEMPNLRIDDYSESLIRNFIAYEQYSEYSSLHHVKDYFIFMSYLINSTKDVELLRRAGIVSNESGNDEKLARMMNELTCSITYKSKSFYYAKEFEKINLHCGKKMNEWKAKLKRDYFNTPWAPISALAAFILLVLAAMQTAFTMLSYVAPKS